MREQNIHRLPSVHPCWGRSQPPVPSSSLGVELANSLVNGTMPNRATLARARLTCPKCTQFYQPLKTKHFTTIFKLYRKHYTHLKVLFGEKRIIIS